MSIRRLRAEFAIGTVVGVIFVGLGVYVVVNFFVSNQAVFGRYFIGGLACIFLGIAVLRMTVPVFFPLKKNYFSTLRTCQYCGAIVKEDAEVCEKCKQPLDLTAREWTTLKTGREESL